MEQNNQQVSQKPSLPIKTKIAAWWIIIVWGVIIPFFIFFAVTFCDATGLNACPSFQGPVLFIDFFLFIISFVLGINILFRRKWAWWTSIIIYSTLFFLTLFNSGLTFSLLPSLILLLLDRKNFWKIAK